MCGRTSRFVAEFAHTQLHSARARAITDRVLGRRRVYTALLRRCDLRATSTKCGRGQKFAHVRKPLEKFQATPL